MYSYYPVLFISSVCVARCFEHIRAEYYNEDSEDGFKLAVLNRMQKLEDTILFHPSELDTLRRELYAEMDDIRAEHAKEISNLRDAFLAELVSIRMENEINMADMKNAHKEEMLAVKESCLAELKTMNRKEGVSDMGLIADEIQNDTIAVDAGLDEGDDVPFMESSGRKHDSKSQIPRIRRQENAIVVAFFATLTKSLHHLGSNQDIVFDHVVTNTGNAYDSRRGIFRAPVAGVYVFSTSLVVENNDQTHVGFVLNNSRLTILYLNGREKVGDSASNTIVLHLDQGDDVTVQNIDSDKSIYGDRHSMISGFLLVPDYPQPAIVGK